MGLLTAHPDVLEEEDLETQNGIGQAVKAIRTEWTESDFIENVSTQDSAAHL